MKQFVSQVIGVHTHGCRESTSRLTVRLSPKKGDSSATASLTDSLINYSLQMKQLTFPPKENQCPLTDPLITLNRAWRGRSRGVQTDVLCSMTSSLGGCML